MNATVVIDPEEVTGAYRAGHLFTVVACLRDRVAGEPTPDAGNDRKTVLNRQIVKQCR